MLWTSKGYVHENGSTSQSFSFGATQRQKWLCADGERPVASVQFGPYQMTRKWKVVAYTEIDRWGATLSLLYSELGLLVDREFVAVFRQSQYLQPDEDKAIKYTNI
jgi:hypothetical protein